MSRQREPFERKREKKRTKEHRRRASLPVFLVAFAFSLFRSFVQVLVGELHGPGEALSLAGFRAFVGNSMST